MHLPLLTVQWSILPSVAVRQPRRSPCLCQGSRGGEGEAWDDSCLTPTQLHLTRSAGKSLSTDSTYLRATALPSLPIEREDVWMGGVNRYFALRHPGEIMEWPDYLSMAFTRGLDIP